VAKHSRADRVEVSLGLLGKEIELVVKDNGQGFDLAEMQTVELRRRGIGLESIREHTVIFGGSLDIKKDKDKALLFQCG
jgi:signal transduction histidine kinase